MYNKKYILADIKSGKCNPMHNHIIGKVCYLAYFKVGERGWFLCDHQTEMNPVHRIHTSEVKRVQYTHDNQVIVFTKNTKYVFEEILDEKEN